VDDLHMLADRPASVHEIGSLLAGCLAAGGRVACAMTCGPTKAHRVVASLASSVDGLLLRLRALSSRHLGRVHDQAARERGLEVLPTVLQQIAQESGGDVRTALGGMARWQLRQGLERPRE